MTLLAAPCRFLWCCNSCGCSVAILLERLLPTTTSSAAGCRCLSVAAVALVKSAAFVAAPLCLAVLACCGPRLLPRQLAVLPDGMVPGIISPGIRILGWSCAVLRSFVISTCVAHHGRHQSSFLILPPPQCPCLIPHDGYAISVLE